ncbi:MAG: cupin domain-containing protein [Streptosporangiaceae bacterium]
MSYPKELYQAGAGEVSGRFRPAGSPPDLVIGGDATRRTEVSYLATGAGTGGQYGLYRWAMGAEPSGAGAHFHKTMSESFFVLDGTVELFDGDRWTTGREGDFLFVPPGGIHAFGNTEGPATMLLLFAPGAPRERYFEELAAILGDGRMPAEAEWAELWRRHDQYPA